MRPIELLQQELEKLISARDKSIKALDEGKISVELHDQHIMNLTPMIEEYKYIIRIVKDNIE
jgi:hypothetical protein